MRVRFETSVEDVVAFNRYHCENSPMWRRQRLIVSCLGPLAIALFSLVYVLGAVEEFADNPVGLVTVGGGVLALNLALSIPLFFLMRWLIMRNVISNVRKLLAEGSNRLLGWREMELVNNRLVMIQELSETRLDLRAIEKIVRNDAYTFVYVASISALMIPMNRYPEDDYREFVAELLEAWENREAPPPQKEAAPKMPADARIVERESKGHP